MEEAKRKREVESEQQGDDARFDSSLRPRSFDEVVGQTALLDNLKVFVKAAGARGEPLDHVLFCGAAARAIKLPLKRFTLIGATTRTGLLTGPLRDRFGIVNRLDFYPPGDLQEIVRRSARKLQVQIDDPGAHEIARRARGTPRIANRLLRRVRDFAEVDGDGRVTQKVADRALQRLEVDGAGLDPMDRKILTTLIDKFGGGPVGVDTVATAVGEQPDTLEDVYEPFLMMEGFLVRTPRGRAATPRAYEHLGRKVPTSLQGSLL